MKMTFKVALVFLFLTGLVFVKPTSSYAYWRGHVWVGVGWPGPYYYGYPYGYPYGYTYPYYSEPTYVVTSASYQPVVVNGVTYYMNNGTYYLYTQYGYQAVAAPAGAAAAPAAAPQATVTQASDDSITVNIPNDKGGYTPVVLKKSGTGFVGPQGEYYSEFPKISQLQTMYGK